MAVKFNIDFPVANALRFTQTNVNGDRRARFDQQRIEETNSASNPIMYPYHTPVEKDDGILVQFLTNYSTRRIKIVDCDGQIYNPFTGLPGSDTDAYVPSMLRQYRGLKYRVDAKFNSLDGKLFLYFEDGKDYLDEDFTMPDNDVDYEGVLPPINAKAGDLVRYKIDGGSFTSALIIDKGWSPDLQSEGYILNVSQSLSDSVKGVAEVNYNEKSVNLYSQFVDVGELPDGLYRVLVELGTNDYKRVFESNILDIQTTHEDTLAVDYRHEGKYDSEDNWGFVYPEGWFNRLRFPADFYKFDTAGEIETDTDDTGVQRVIRAVPFRQLEFSAYNVPSWVADKMVVVLSHDTKVVNGNYWEVESLGEYSPHGKRNVGNYKVKLRQKDDRTIFTNEYDEDLTAYFEPASFIETSFEGAIVQATFRSNTGLPFKFNLLPDWITVDKETGLVDGDVVTITIAANVPSVGREATISAFNETIDGLIATVYIQQDFDVAVSEYLEVSDETVALLLAGSNQNIDVNASGPYEYSQSGDFSFDLVDVDSDTFNIGASSDVVGSIPRTSTIRVQLVSNPTVYKDIAVQQNTVEELYEVTPASLLYHGTDTQFTQIAFVTIDASAAAQWQASSPNNNGSGLDNDWLRFNTDMWVGPTTNFKVTVMPKPSYMPYRTGIIVFTNINNPSEHLQMSVSQEDV